MFTTSSACTGSDIAINHCSNRSSLFCKDIHTVMFSGTAITIHTEGTTNIPLACSLYRKW